MNKIISVISVVSVISGSLFATVINVPADQPTIQAGIDFAVDGDTVLVASGTYVENINFNGKNIVVTSVEGAENTIIDGNQNGSVVTINSGENSTAVLSGFMITNGSGTQAGTYIKGGGILVSDASPHLQYLVIYKNSAQYGGGISFYNSSSFLENAVLKADTADGAGQSQGGGIYASYCDLTISNLAVLENYSPYTGGGVMLVHQDGTVINNAEIYNNESPNGGGVSISESSVTINNALIFNNKADVGGGLKTWGTETSLVLNRVTIVENFGEFAGGGIILQNGSAILSVNTIIWGNDIPQICFWPDSPAMLFESSYSDIEGGEEAIQTFNSGWVNWYDGNIDADPLFRDVENRDYSLQEDSPCIDAGITEYFWMGEQVVDISYDEYYGTAPDMGAFEFGFEEGLLGDVNNDGVLNVLDIILVVNIIMEQHTPNDYELWAADANEDGNINVMDIVLIVGMILEN